MKERPILFNGAMVRAILAGMKTQDRRIAQFDWNSHCVPFKYTNKAGNKVFGRKFGDVHELANIHCPYGQPGDRLWVRETWGDVNNYGAPAIAYRADGDLMDLMEHDSFLCDDGSFDYEAERIKPYSFCAWASDLIGEIEGGWRPSTHMPRWASRILLEVVDVRAVRLQDISEADALAEGVKSCEAELHNSGNWYAPEELYSMLWTKINGWGASGWNANPCVWVVEFRRVKA